MLKSPGIYLLSGIIIIAAWSISTNSPPDPVGTTAPDTVFSSERAAVYLDEICKEPHSTGTSENKRVREYIREKCRQFGLEAEIQQTTAVNRRAAAFQGTSAIYSANVYNVVAHLRGTNSGGKCVVVMAHFDTQPNTPGAGDDGASVAAMLETIHNLTSSGKKLTNDIVFLFTDAEELGMLGAVGYAQDTVQLRNVGLLLNFDNRGNSGPLNMFETNPQNGWVVKHFLKAAEYPFGNSLGYEIYRLLPNDTDFSIFRRAGISGLNQSFISGYVNYHSPTDKPADLDRGSLQHCGANMLSLVKHFGNTSLENTRADNVSYFAIAGHWVVSHPASWNPVLIVLCIVIVLSYIFLAARKRMLTVKGFIGTFFIFIGVLCMLMLAGVALSLAVGALYPAYRNFYSNNSYNAWIYQIGFASIGVLLFAWVYRTTLRKTSSQNVFGSVLLVLSIILVLLYQVIPTAIFIVLFPLMFFAAGCIALLYRKSIYILIISALPALWWFSGTIKQIFVVFGITPEVGGVLLIMGLMLAMMLPLFDEIFRSTGTLTMWICFTIFLISLVAGHLTSGFSAEKPLQTYLSYSLNADEGKAYWQTSRIDDWTRQFFPEPRKEGYRISNETPALPYPSPELKITNDTTVNDTRHLTLHCSARKEAITMRVDFGKDNPATDVSVIGPAGGRGNDNRTRGNFFTVHYAGVDSAGFDLVVETKAGKPFDVTLTDRSLGLPLGNRVYPPEFIPGTGYNANTVQVTKKFTIEN